MPEQISVENLIFNKSEDCFEASLKLKGRLYSFEISDLAENETMHANIIAAKIKDWLQTNLDKSKEFTASKLLNLKNENWLSENEDPISSKKFIETIEFDGILAFAEGGFEIYFMDHDLFGGHTIIVDVNEDFEFEDAKIAG